MENSFNPREVTIMASVVHAASRQVGCADEMAMELLALRVLDHAARGERKHGFEGTARP